MTTPARRSRLRLVAAATALVLGVTTAAVLVATRHHDEAPATLQQITDFDSVSDGLEMYLYAPHHLPKHAPVLVAVHYCTGSADAFYTGTDYARLADEHGFLVVYPSATRQGHCFDGASAQALEHDGGSDPTSIVHMVRWVQSHYSTDESRVFVTGLSSGAIMTEVLLADYPDVFAAGSAFAGVPAGCFASDAPPPTGDAPAGYNQECSLGQVTKTAQQWGDLVRAAYPGYTGKRPRVQLWHGTADTTLAPANFDEAVKEWTNVLGVSETPASTDTPAEGHTRTRYGATSDQAPVEAILEDGVTHDIDIDEQAVIRFFGLDS